MALHVSSFSFDQIVNKLLLIVIPGAIVDVTRVEAVRPGRRDTGMAKRRLGSATKTIVIDVALSLSSGWGLGPSPPDCKQSEAVISLMLFPFVSQYTVFLLCFLSSHLVETMARSPQIACMSGMEDLVWQLKVVLFVLMNDNCSTVFVPIRCPCSLQRSQNVVWGLKAYGSLLLLQRHPHCFNSDTISASINAFSVSSSCSVATTHLRNDFFCQHLLPLQLASDCVVHFGF